MHVCVALPPEQAGSLVSVDLTSLKVASSPTLCSNYLQCPWNLGYVE